MVASAFVAAWANPVIRPEISNRSPIFLILFINVSPSMFVCLAQDKKFSPGQILFDRLDSTLSVNWQIGLWSYRKSEQQICLRVSYPPHPRSRPSSSIWLASEDENEEEDEDDFEGSGFCATAFCLFAKRAPLRHDPAA
jgi:hypothetical protein